MLGRPETLSCGASGNGLSLWARSRGDWEADDFDPWNSLRWETVPVFFYRQHKPNGTVVEACWLTKFPSRVGVRAVFDMAKSRWEIEKEGVPLPFLAS